MRLRAVTATFTGDGPILQELSLNQPYLQCFTLTGHLPRYLATITRICLGLSMLFSILGQ